MTRELRHMSFEEFTTDIARVFERVTGAKETVVVERENGTAAVLKPLAARRSPRARRVVTEADWEAFLSSAGGWQDLDTDKLVANIYESRRISSRPPVEL